MWDELFEEIPLLELDDQTSGATASSTPKTKTASTTNTTTEQDDGWPTKEDPYAWAAYGPGMIDIGFGFYPWNLGTTSAAWNQSDVGSSDYGQLLRLLELLFAGAGIGDRLSPQAVHLGPELQQSTTRAFEYQHQRGIHYRRMGVLTLRQQSFLSQDRV